MGENISDSMDANIQAIPKVNNIIIAMVLKILFGFFLSLKSINNLTASSLEITFKTSSEISISLPQYQE